MAMQSVLVQDGTPGKTIKVSATAAVQTLDMADLLDASGEAGAGYGPHQGPKSAFIQVEGADIRFAFHVDPVIDWGHTLEDGSLLLLKNKASIQEFRFIAGEADKADLYITPEF